MSAMPMILTLLRAEETGPLDSAQILVALLGAGGGGAALLALINGFIKWLNGSAGRERDRNTSLADQRKQAVIDRDKAERDRDDVERRNRNILEYASLLRRQLIEAGLEPIKMPTDTQEPPPTKYEGKPTDEP